MFKKLKSNRGVFLSLIAYPILILLVGFSLGTFVRSINGNNQAKIHLESLQAEYQAYKGVEFAFYELRNQSTAGKLFLTHQLSNAINGDTTLAQILPAPTPSFREYTINSEGAYRHTLDDYSGRPTFFIKTYREGDDIYFLVKGRQGNRNRIFVNKIAGTSIYDYFSFFQGDASFGNETVDASGGKIHANGSIRLDEGAKILNVKELSSAGAMFMAYNKYVAATKESTYPMYRAPWWMPAGYSNSAPPPNNTTGSYRNSPDGHYPGDHYGLYAWDGAKYVKWDPSNVLQATLSPIPISAEDVGAVPGVTGKNWAALDTNNNTSVIYYNKDADGNPCNPNKAACSPNASLPSINGISIPNRLSGSYTVDKYFGATGTTSINLTNSEKQASAWDAFINSQAKLKGAVKAGTRNGANYITPPKIEVSKLIEAADQSKAGMSIKKDAQGKLIVKINGGDEAGGTTVDLGTNPTAGCAGHTVFTKRAFMNQETALKDEVVEIDVGKLMACEGQQPAKWIPKNNIIFADHGLALSNAATLPAKGLTTIVRGNFIVKGQYNTDTWQPSAAIVSDYSYLVSDGFNWPTTLRYTQHHAEYPYARSYDGTNVLPAGVGLDRDFVTGYNWQFRNQANMANAVTGGTLVNNVPTYTYNISLIGNKAYNPRFLERWKYYANAGTDAVAPSNLATYRAVVQGAFVQIGRNEFAPTLSLQSPVNPRRCTDASLKYDINGAALPATFPCRANSSSVVPEDLLAWNDNEQRTYEPKFLSTAERPPGTLLALSQSGLIELPYTSENWTKHNIKIFPSSTLAVSPDGTVTPTTPSSTTPPPQQPDTGTKIIILN